MEDLARLPAISLAVVGADFDNPDRSNRRFEIALCAPGEPINLLPEPKNPADPNAVAVFSPRGTQLGYIRAEQAPRIGAIIRQNREWTAAFQRKSSFGAWIRMAFDGEEPRLTPAMVAEDPSPPLRNRPPTSRDDWVDTEPGFYPDEVWPDD